MTFKSPKDRQVDPTEAIELPQFTGPVRESQVIHVQPLARAAKGSTEILFGRIARDCGFINQKALDRCIQKQKEGEHGERRFLGDILIEQDLLSRMEVDEILKIQHRNLQKRYRYSSEEQGLFGRLVIKRKLATKEQVHECIRWQAEMERFNEKVPLGELLIAKGYVSDDDVESVLRLQSKGTDKGEPEPADDGESDDDVTISEDSPMRPPPAKPAAKPAKSKSRRAPAEPEAPPAVAHLESSSNLEALDAGGAAPPPSAVVKGWFLGLLGRAYGPLPKRLLTLLFESGAFGPDDLFWHHEQAGWSTARHIDELAAYIAVGEIYASHGGPPLPRHAKSPKALAEAFDALRERGKLEEIDHVKLRKMLSQPITG